MSNTQELQQAELLKYFLSDFKVEAHCFSTTSSTMDEAFSLLKTKQENNALDLEARLLVTAEEQISGRGRQGRQWLAPKGSSLLMTYTRISIFKPSLPLVIACSLHKVLSEFCSGLKIRWPNDILSANKKKLSGILLERKKFNSLNKSEAFDFIGIGVNLSEANIENSTSIKDLLYASKELPSNIELAAKIVHQLEVDFAALIEFGFLEFKEYWLKNSYSLGELIKFNSATEKGFIVGEFAGISDEGCLYLKLNDEIKSFIAGDVLLS